jgi:peroxiredoxin
MLKQDDLAAPPLDVSQWFNTERPLDLAELRGRVVVLYAFQMLCPGCVMRSLPQAQAISQRFGNSGVTVLGLHTVFEHHEAMKPITLAAFIQEYRLQFPIGVDRASGTGSVPHTMRAYQLRGTPSLVVIDRVGRVRHSVFGHVDDLQLGVWLGSLSIETQQISDLRGYQEDRERHGGDCSQEVCRTTT